MYLISLEDYVKAGVHPLIIIKLANLGKHEKGTRCHGC